MAGSVGDETTQMGPLAGEGLGDEGERGRLEVLRSTHRDVLVRYATSWSAADPERIADQALIEAHGTFDGTENQRNARGQLFGIVRDMVGREQEGAGPAAAAAARPAPGAGPTMVAPSADAYGPVAADAYGPAVADAYGPAVADAYGPAAADATTAMGPYNGLALGPATNDGPLATPEPMARPDYGYDQGHGHGPVRGPGPGPRPMRGPREQGNGNLKPLVLGAGILVFALLFIVGLLSIVRLLAVTGGSDDTATDPEVVTADSVSTTSVAEDGVPSSSAIVEAPSAGPTMQVVGVTPGGTITGVVGEEAVAPSFAVTGMGDEALLFSADGLPAGVFIDSTTGSISGAPSSACECEVTVRVIDREGLGDEIRFRWDVTDGSTTTSTPADSTSTTEVSTTEAPAATTTSTVPSTSTSTTAAPTTSETTSAPGNQAPTIELTWSGYPLESTVSSGVPVEVTFASGDPDGDPLTFSGIGLPAGVAVDPDNGSLQGVVAAECICRVVIVVDDGRGGRGTVSFEWIVRP